MYKLFIKPIFFLFDPESIHHFVFSLLKFLFAIPGINSLVSLIYKLEDKRLNINVLGLNFPNPIGLAAGFDKNGELIDEMACLGFGFIEIGTVTPRPQPGNDKPRLFRLPADQGLINRMGFNTEGLIETIENLKKRNSKIIIGGNIGKNKITPNENATDDYQKCFEGLFPYVDYFVVNVSSPNTPNLRDLQEKEPLTKLLNDLQKLNKGYKVPKPILLKIAPDLTESQLDDIVEIVATTQIAGIIATNTTISRANLLTSEEEINKIGAGGLSGKPLNSRSTEVINYLSKKSNKKIPIIAAGGIFNAKDAEEKLSAGASLVQVYTGFIYEGPSIAKNICRGLLK
ncbi:MAG: quinone-dependent dihydroorotate dehydrogenase [Bacteroidota bacterium]